MGRERNPSRTEWSEKLGSGRTRRRGRRRLHCGEQLDETEDGEDEDGTQESDIEDQDEEAGTDNTDESDGLSDTGCLLYTSRCV